MVSHHNHFYVIQLNVEWEVNSGSQEKIWLGNKKLWIEENFIEYKAALSNILLNNAVAKFNFIFIRYSLIKKEQNMEMYKCHLFPHCCQLFILSN